MPTFIINKRCIGCHACSRVAEENIIMEGRKAVLVHQPRNEEELAYLRDALKGCPTHAIEEISSED